MALANVPMNFQDGLRCTSTTPPLCMSFAQALLSDLFDEMANPQFTVTYRFRFSVETYAGECRVVRANAGGSQIGWGLAVSNDGGLFRVTASLVTVSMGTVIQHSLIPGLIINTSEHSVTWVYDAAGNSSLFFNGSLVAQSAALIPANQIPGGAVTDTMSIFAGSNPVEAAASRFIDVDEVGWFPGVIDAATAAIWHDNGLAAA